MLLRHRPPAIDSQPGTTSESYAHLSVKSITVLRWLKANGVEHVLVGPVADAIRGGTAISGPVSIVPAPYGRNYGRLSRALWSEHARLRVDGEADTVPIKLNEEKLLRGGRWTLRCGVHDFDIEGRPAGAPSYQELLYEAARFELAPDLSVDVASPEDLEHYAHVRRTGTSPEIRITRTPVVKQRAAAPNRPADEAAVARTPDSADATATKSAGATAPKAADKPT
jgi:hypothetical protein